MKTISGMDRWIKCLLLQVCAGVFAVTAMAATPPRQQPFNVGWVFRLGDTVDASAEDFDDSSWQRLTLPHDWSIAGRFDKAAPAGNDGGYLPTGIGWYRKVFTVDPNNAGKKLRLYFEGVYMNSEVYVNGRLAGGWPYGYSSFFVDITPFVHSGENTVAVRVDNSKQKNSRWYSGSGIYRNVWLIATERIHVADWGIQVTTPDLHRAVVRVAVANETDIARDLDVKVELDGQVQTGICRVGPGDGASVIEHEFYIPDARPWSPDSPDLYTAYVTVSDNGRVVDRVEQVFGFRTVEWSADGGLLLNGEPVVLNGGCVHHDNGILGAAAYDRAERHRVELLKKAGFNALRTSHNVPSEAFLRACDEVGLLVIDEVFDGWRDPKNDCDYHLLFDDWWRRDVDAMVLRDRNHPSVFCWSIGNEVIERKKIEVVTTARKLAGRCRELDPTRPVTSALASWDSDWEIYDPLAAEHDIVGYNYMIHKSESDHERVPARVMMQTESYPADAWQNFRKVKDYAYIVGDFVWTAMDYIGESGIGRWYYDGDVPGEHFHRPLYPWHAAYCGDIDLTGLRKPVSHYRSMLWNADGEHLYIAVKEPDGYRGRIVTTMWGTWPTFESWNWPGHEGRDIDVEVYSHYPVVRLYQDDRFVGEKTTAEMKAVFTVCYEPGVLRAEGVSDGLVCESVVLQTAGEPVDLRLTADRTRLDADGQDLSFITVEIVDGDGLVVPVADRQLSVSVSGAATLLALGNADIKDEDPYSDSRHLAWNGRALAVVRSNGRRGSATVKITAEDLGGRKVTRDLRLVFE